MTLLLPIEDCLWKSVSHTLSHKFGVVDIYALCSTVNLSNTHVESDFLMSGKYSDPDVKENPNVNNYLS